jgi:hypothetical protein
MSYQDKYLKYKNKYLDLKKMLGGDNSLILNNYKEVKNPYIKVCEQAKFYTSSSFSDKLINLLNTCNENMNKKNLNLCIRIIDVLNDLAVDSPIYIAGGVVRDIMHDIPVKDIDIKFKFSNKAQISLLCDKLGLKCSTIWENKDSNLVYVKFGDDTDKLDGLEGQTINEIKIDHLENDVNGLMYDIVNKVIIDPTGTGVINNLKFKFQICQNTFDQWSDNTENKGPLRFFKMLQKNYTLVDEQQVPLKNWLLNNINRFTKPVYNDTPCSIIVWVLCKTIRGDDIEYKTGIMLKKGKNEKKLYELLNKMKEFSEDFYKLCIKNLHNYDNTIIADNYI